MLKRYGILVLVTIIAALAMVACDKPAPTPEVTVLETVELHGADEVMAFFANDVPEGARMRMVEMSDDPSAAVPRVCYWMEIRPAVGMWVYIYLN